MIKKSLLGLLTFYSLLQAEEINIKFKDVSILSATSIYKLTGLKKIMNTDDLKPSDIQNAINILKQQGYFKNIWITENNKTHSLIFNFIEKMPIVSLKIKGYKEDLSLQEISSFLNLPLGSFYDLSKMEEVEQRIITDLSLKGYTNTKVDISKEINDNSVALVINVDKGHIKKIEKLSFIGNKEFTKAELESVISNKEKDTLGWLWGFNDGKFKKAELPIDEKRLKEKYLERGYLDMKVNYVDTKKINDNTVNINFDIDEGKQFKINKFHIVSNLYSKELNKLFTLKTGSIFNLKIYQKRIKDIKIFLGNKGYAYPIIKPQISKKDESSEINLNFSIDCGNKYIIKNVIIDGNTRTLDQVIRRELYLASGDVYNKEDLIESQKSLQRTGYFSSSIIKEEKISNHEINLIVQVKETKTGTIQVGGGYGSYGGLMGTLSVSDRNIFGSGLDTAFKLEKSQMTFSNSLSLSNPKLNDSDFSGNVSIYKNNNQYNDYTVDTTGISFGVGKKINRHLSIYTGYIYNDTSYSNFKTDYLNTEYADSFETYKKSAVMTNFSFNNTDDYYIPSSGIKSNISIEKAGLGGNADFIKNNFNLNYFYSLKNIIDKDIIFRFKNKSTYIYDSGFVPLSEKLYLGGINSIRGYESYSISPTKIDSDGHTVNIGGNLSLVNTIELSTALTSRNLRLVGFMDYGLIGEDNINEIKKAGYGVGIEWISPMGPVKVMYSRPLYFNALTDRESNFEFSFGQSF